MPPCSGLKAHSRRPTITIYILDANEVQAEHVHGSSLVGSIHLSYGLHWALYCTMGAGTYSSWLSMHPPLGLGRPQLPACTGQHGPINIGQGRRRLCREKAKEESALGRGVKGVSVREGEEERQFVYREAHDTNLCVCKYKEFHCLKLFFSIVLVAHCLFSVYSWTLIFHSCFKVIYMELYWANTATSFTF